MRNAAIAVLVALTLLPAGEARAASASVWATVRQVQALTPNGTSLTFAFNVQSTSGVAPAGCTNGWFGFSSSNADQAKSAWALLVAAQLSDKPVWVQYEGSNCQAYNVTLGPP